MKEQLEKIKEEALQQISSAESLDTLNDIRVAYLGKKGELTSLLKSMKDVAPEDRPKVGQLVNEARAVIEGRLEEAKAALAKKAREEQLKREVIDVTLPAKKNSVGHSHPNTIALEAVERIFVGMGYEVVEGPEVEYDEYNFTKLNIPPNHPAKDEQDTFYINDTILADSKIKRDISLDSVYYLLGDSYSQLEEYENASNAYESAIRINSENGSYYRDYAIAEAYCGNTNKAEELLNEAADKGLSTADVSYVKGEIQYNTGDYSSAEEIFRDCAENSRDSYIQMRSYIMAVKCMDKQNDSIDSKKQQAQFLEKARKELPSENNIGILEELAQVYSDLGADTGDSGYYQSALEIFDQIESRGMGDYDTACNIAVLYQNMDDYANAQEKLQEMLKTYGEDYRTYKNLAFLEVAVQGKKAEDTRDYSKFQEYYKKAKELYQEQLSSNANDMDRMDDLYQQAVQSGWIS